MFNCEELEWDIVEPKGFAADGLIQLHWQDPVDCSQTIMVAQCDGFKSVEQIQAWVRETIDRRIGDCPKDWRPLVCDSASRRFWVAAPRSK